METKKRGSRIFNLSKNVGILTLSNLSSSILSFFLVPLYSNILSSSEYGLFDLVASSVFLLFPVLTLNISDAVSRFLLESEDDKKSITSIGIKYTIYSAIPVAAVLLIFRYFDIFKSVNEFGLLIFLYYSVYVLNQLLIQTAKGLDKVLYLGIAGLLNTITFVSCNLVFLLVFKAGVQGLLLANILSQFSSLLFLCVSLKIWSLFEIRTQNKILFKNMILYSMPLIFTIIGWWVNDAADKYVVTFYLGIGAGGILSMAYKIPSILNVFQTVFVQAWQISAVKEYKSDDSNLFYGDVFLLFSFCIGLSCSALLLFLKIIANLLFSNDFNSSWLYVPFLLLACVINISSGFLGPILSAYKNSRDMALSAIIGSISNILLNFLLVKMYGIQGATVATVISSFFIYIIRRIAVGDKITVKQEYCIYVSWILLAIQSIIVINSWRIILEIVVIVVLLVLNRDTIKKIIDRLVLLASDN